MLGDDVIRAWGKPTAPAPTPAPTPTTPPAVRSVLPWFVRDPRTDGLPQSPPLPAPASQAIPSSTYPSGSCAHTATRDEAGRCMLCDARAEEQVVDAETRPGGLAALSPEQLAKLARDASAERMRRNLSLFVIRGWHVLEPDTPLEWSWVQQTLCDHLQALLEDWFEYKRTGKKQRAQNLAINAWPGSLKSRLALVYLPAWVWTRWPTWQVTCTSVAESNIKRDAELCRDVITSPWYRETFGVAWSIREDVDAKFKFMNTAGGQRQAVHFKGKLTGLKGHCWIGDDFDDSADVHSPADREKSAEKVRALYNRLNDRQHDIRISLQQRVHAEDRTDQLLAIGWDHLPIPLEWSAARRCRCAKCWNADTATPRPTFIGWLDPRSGGPDGVVAQPERNSPETIAADRLSLGEWRFNAEFNQAPASLDAGMFKRTTLRFFTVEGEFAGDARRPEGAPTRDVLPARVLTRRGRQLLVDGQPLEWVCISVDASHGSLKDTASRCAMVVIGGRGADRFVLHDSTRVRSYSDTRSDLLDLVDAWHPDVVLIEAKANGRPVIEELGSVIEGLKPYDPKDGSKEQRAQPMMPAFDAGQVYFLDGAAWVDDFADELCTFPRGKHDDRVDALSQCLTHYRMHEPPLRKWRAIAAARSQIIRRRE